MPRRGARRELSAPMLECAADVEGGVEEEEEEGVSTLRATQRSLQPPDALSPPPRPVQAARMMAEQRCADAKEQMKAVACQLSLFLGGDASAVEGLLSMHAQVFCCPL